MTSNDYLEIDLYLQDKEKSPTLLAHFTNGGLASFNDLRHNLIRYQGSWSVAHKFVGQNATSFIPTADVKYFTILEPATKEPDSTDDDYLPEFADTADEDEEGEPKLNDANYSLSGNDKKHLRKAKLSTAGTKGNTVNRNILRDE
jgi:hypothetical protein